MRKRSLYGIAVTILAVSIGISGISYRKFQYYEDEAAFAAGVLDYGKRLHLADDEHPLHFEGGAHPFYERSSLYSEDFYAHRFYQRICLVSALVGFTLSLILIYYASTRSTQKS